MLNKPYILFFLITIFFPNCLNAQSDKPLHTYKEHSDQVLSVKYSPDGTRFLSGSADKTYKLWDVETGTVIFSSKKQYDKVYSVNYTLDGTNILTGGGRMINIFTSEAKFIGSISGHTTSIWSIETTKSDPTIIATGSFNKFFLVWNIEKRESLFKSKAIDKSILAVSISPDGKHIAAGAQDHRIYIYDATTFETIKIIEAHADNIFCVSFSPCGKFLASCSGDNTIKIWNTSDWGIHKLLGQHEHAVMELDFNSNGIFIASASYDATIKIWDVESGELITSFIDSKLAMNTLDISPDNSTILCGGADNKIRIWNIDKELIVNFYMADEFNKELSSSELMQSQKAGESKQEYKERQVKAKKYANDLLIKYFNLLMKR